MNCPKDGDDRVVVTLGNGRNLLNNNAAIGDTTALPMTVTGGSGDDGIKSGTSHDVISGGGGVDVIGGLSGNDVIDGGDGPDFIDGGLGSDALSGGTGFDRVSYNVSADLTLTLDGVANDGDTVAAEGDNIGASIEDVRGGSGNDTISGTTGATTSAAAVATTRSTGAAASTLTTSETATTSRSCATASPSGSSAMTATTRSPVDDVDTLANCESDARRRARPRPRQGRRDKPADCNDANPLIRPGIADVLDNGIDEDCDGLDATDMDRDRDGVPRPLDCDDGNPAIRPGRASKLRQQGRRELQRPRGPAADDHHAGASALHRRPRSGADPRLQVVGATKGTRVQVRCKGSGCAFKLRKLTLKRTTRKLDLRKRYKLRRLGRQRLEIRLLRSDSIGRVVRFTGSGGGIPSTRILCLPPGKKKPRRC